ncbi:hypothetical protein COOONC_04966 [Cooperia oncophora]
MTLTSSMFTQSVMGKRRNSMTPDKFSHYAIVSSEEPAMDQVYRYELTKAVKRLQQVMDSIDKSLLEDAQFDGDQEVGYEVTEANYEMAINTLREAYFRPDLIRMQLSDRLQHLQPATTRAVNQRLTFARIKSLWLQLKKYGEHDDNIFVMRLIREKFPLETLEYVGQAQAIDTVPWKVPQLLNALDQAIKTFEVIEDSAPAEPTSSPSSLAIYFTSQSSP